MAGVSRTVVLVLSTLILGSVGAPVLAFPVQPSAPAQGSASNKATEQVQKLIDAGHTAQNAKPPRRAEAQQLYEKALAAAQSLHDPTGESAALRNLGNLAYLGAETAKALEYYQRSLERAGAAGNKAEQADTQFNMAIMLAPAVPAKAMEFAEQARANYHETGNAKHEGEALSLIGHLLAVTGQQAQAKAKYEQAIVLARSVHDPKGEADALWYLGVMAWTGTDKPLFDQASVASAKTYFQQALALYHEIHATADEATTVDLLAGLSILQGNLDEGRTQYERALALYRETGNDAKMASVLATLSNVTGMQDRRLEAFQYDQEALELYRKLGDKVGQAVQLSHIGAHYSGVGQQRTALQYHVEALKFFQQAGDVDHQVSSLNSIGEIYDILGDHQTALSYYKQVIPLLEKPTSALARKHNLGILAAIYSFTGNNEKAHETLLLQLEDLKKSGLTPLIPSTLSLLAQVERSQGKSEMALEKYKEVLTMSDPADDGRTIASTLASISEIEEEKGDLASAERDAAKAVEGFEHSRIALGGLAEAKSTFLNTNIGVYKHYVSLLLRRDKAEEAFAMTQKIKARGLLDLLSGGKVQIAASLTPEERQEESALRQKSDALNYQLAKEGVQNEIGSMKRAEAIKAQIAETERDLQTLEDRLYARHPDLAQKRGATTVTLADTAKFVPEDTALLEYVTLSAGKKEEIALFVVTTTAGRSALTTHTIPADLQHVRALIDALRSACSDPRKEYRTAAADLYKLLVAPAEAEIAGKKRLVVCPDGPIWDTPFAALIRAPEGKSAPNQTGFLLERFEIDYAYSATGAAAAVSEKANRQRRQPERTILAVANPAFGGEKRFGDDPGPFGKRPIVAPSRPITAPSRPITAPSRPITAPSRPILAPSRPITAPSRELYVPRGGTLAPLPGTLLEARAIQNSFKGSTLLIGADAQEATVKRQAGKYRYLHFATHGFFNDAAPLLSSIVLALPDKATNEDGFLTAREIFGLNLSADMVVMSACNTALGEKRNGEGIIGLTWALFAAGAPSQVVSQWSVNDDSTAQLMTRFYSNLTQKKLRKGASLRQAALSVMRSGGANPESSWSHPYFWAPFVLVGDWR